MVPSFAMENHEAEGRISVDALVESLHITKIELASATGLSRDAVSKRVRVNARRTQSRLREVVEIIQRVLPWAGSVQAAFSWYRSQPLPSFGDQTAEDLVKAGRAEAVRQYLSRIAVGGYT